MQYALEKAILYYKRLYNTNSASSSFSLDVNLVEFPHPQLINTNIIGTSGPAFFLGCLMFNFVIQMGQLVTEKELRLREAMSVVGLQDSIYWGTWILTNMAWNTLSGLLLILAGAIFQFNFFLKNDFGTYFFLFLLFGFSMVAFAIFLSLFLSKARTATSVGFAIYLIGVIIQGAGAFVFSEGTNSGIQVIFKLLPFTLLAKGMGDLGDKTATSDDVGLRWDDRNNYGYFPVGDVYSWLIIDFFIYLGLALIYDFLFGGVRGQSRVRKWLFK
jgi:ABC-type multidrug transport system permease subunit